jgi:hypothetical protein
VRHERQRRAHLHARNIGLNRLRTLTRALTVAMTALAGVFAGLAAASNGGHRHVRTLPPAAPRPVRSATGRSKVPPPPSLPPLSQNSGSAPSAGPGSATPPAQAPVPAQAPPVAVSGGS